MPINTKLLADELEKRGLVPPLCRLIDLVVSVNGAVVIKYEKYLSSDEMSKFADAMKTVAEATR